MYGMLFVDPQRLPGAAEYALADASADGALVLLCRRCTSSSSSNAHFPEYLLFERSHNRSVPLPRRLHIGGPQALVATSTTPPAGANEADVEAEVEAEAEVRRPTRTDAAAAGLRVAKLSASGRYLVRHSILCTVRSSVG